MTKKLLRFLQRFIIGFFIITISWVLVYRFIPIAYTPLMAIRAIEQSVNPDKKYHFSKKWVGIDKISPHLVAAVIAAEDQKFREHHGFDLEAIRKSVIHNSKKNQKRIKGASTISQQTAKNAFLWPNRDWIRKGLEAYFTVLIELLWNKERIMEVYLNIIEMGDGIYGAEAAAKHYFGKHASQLNSYEAASIAAILPSPLRRNPMKPGSRTQQHIYWIQEQMQKPADEKQRD